MRWQSKTKPAGVTRHLSKTKRRRRMSGAVRRRTAVPEFIATDAASLHHPARRRAIVLADAAPTLTKRHGLPYRTQTRHRHRLQRAVRPDRIAPDLRRQRLGEIPQIPRA